MTGPSYENNRSKSNIFNSEQNKSPLLIYLAATRNN